MDGFSDFFGDFTGLYFYSTVVQGNMALLGLAALFAVFRLQVLYGLRSESNDKIIFYIKEHYAQAGGLPPWLRHHSWNADQLLHALRAFKGGADYPERDARLTREILEESHLTQLVVEKGVLEHLQKDVAASLKRPLLLTVSVTAISLVLLPFASAIHRLGSLDEGLLFIAVILLNIVALVANFRFVLKSLSHGHPVLG